MNEVKLSPALELLKFTWNGVHRNKTMWSWIRLNHCMHDALNLAIEAGLKFEPDDFAYISKEFRWGWWASDGERYFTHAVKENNMSAIKALEHHFNRKPFITNSVQLNRIRQRGRLAVGARFYWNNSWIMVTSFDDKAQIVIACSYKPTEYDERGYVKGTRKVEHIYKLTHKDLKTCNKEVEVK